MRTKSTLITTLTFWLVSITANNLAMISFLKLIWSIIPPAPALIVIAQKRATESYWAGSIAKIDNRAPKGVTYLLEGLNK